MVQWLRLHASTAGEVDSTPGWGTKILHAAWCSEKKKGGGYSWDNPQHWEKNFMKFSTLEIPDRKNEESRHKGQRERKKSLLDSYRPGKDLPAESEKKSLSLPGWFLAYQSKFTKYIFSQSMPKCNSAKNELRRQLMFDSRKHGFNGRNILCVTVIAAILVLRPVGA